MQATTLLFDASTSASDHPVFERSEDRFRGIIQLYQTTSVSAPSHRAHRHDDLSRTDSVVSDVSEPDPTAGSRGFWCLVHSVPIEYDEHAVLQFFSAGIPLVHVLVILRCESTSAQQALIKLGSEEDRDSFIGLFHHQRFQPLYAEACVALPLDFVLVVDPQAQPCGVTYGHMCCGW